MYLGKFALHVKPHCWKLYWAIIVSDFPIKQFSHVYSRVAATLQISAILEGKSGTKNDKITKSMITLEGINRLRWNQDQFASFLVLFNWISNMAMLVQPLAMAIMAIMAILAIMALMAMANGCTNMVMLGI